MTDFDRTRWHCRRGMLELDLVLERFMDKHFGRLTEQQKEQLHLLLEYEDYDLWEAIMGRKAPENKNLEPVLGLIRAS